ncbi:MAG: undecaprenyl-phosphate glucose phosphotransferase [Alphaproteobacteria bacterium]|nr:undecaprenyl-phosphate glucose phosphotransferase [Alphaproteobacteria bacterium]
MAHIDSNFGTDARSLPGSERIAVIGFLIGFVEYVDLFVIALAAIGANWLRFDSVQIAGARGLLVMLAVVVAYVAFRRVDLHELPVLGNVFTQIRRALTALIAIFAAVVIVGYAAKTGYSISRLWLAYWFLLAGGTLVLTRPLVALLYRRLEGAGYLTRHFVIFATANELRSLQKFLDRWERVMPRSETIAGIFVDKPDQISDAEFRNRYPLLGSIDDFVKWEHNAAIDGAVAVMRAEDRSALEPVLSKLRSVSVDLDLIAGHIDEAWASRPVGKLAGLPVIRVMTQPLNVRQLVLKRLEDIVVSSVALLLLAPVMAIVALAIKLDSPGPVFFRQDRHGFNNSRFSILKFRSMRNDADVLSTVAQARRNDPRITRLGAFLRRTSLDELPQLFNVLKGEMSIVGPRPHAVQHNDHFANRVASYLARHRIKPGITGWAQVNGLRGETDTVEKMSKRVEHDLYYADHWSLYLDLKIMVLTIRCLVHPNAY